MRVTWVTDIHLDFLSQQAGEAFFATMAWHHPDAVFLTGDISVAPTLLGHLRAMGEALNRPSYFVLGNHDFYHGSIARVRQAVREGCQADPLLRYLPDSGVIPLTASTALVGHDGWGDGRYGDYASSPVRLNDHLLIEELTGLSPRRLQRELMRLGDEAAGYLLKTLPQAFARYPRVIVLTHVPPFRESCWYQGHVSNDEWLPFFACQAVGDALREIMTARPHCRLTVYCGHTHHSGTAQVLPNLLVLTGAAEYGAPALSGVLEIE